MTQFTLVDRNHMNFFNDFYIKALVMLSDIVISIEKKSVIKRNKFSMNKNIIILTMTQIL
jgi:hypothetical protein